MIEKVQANNYPAALSYGSGNAPEVNSFVKYEYATIPDNTGTAAKTVVKEYSQDKNGNTTETKEYDFFNAGSLTIPRDSEGHPTGLPSGISSYLKRITKTEYYNDTPDSVSTTYNDTDSYISAGNPRLLRLPQSMEVQNASGTAQSRSEIDYDFKNYNSSNTKGGNVTESKSWDSFKGGSTQAYSNPLTSTNSVSTSVSYDQYGNPTSTTDANNIQTQITYGAVGGYTGLYPTQTVSAYGTSVARTSTATYDFYTGLVTSATDVDNNVTSGTEYDDLGRPTKVKAAIGTSSEIWTQTIYDDANRMVVTKADIEAKGDARKVATQFYDQLGRVRLSKTLEDSATQSATNETDGIKVQTRYLTASNGYSYQLSSNPYRANYSYNATNEESMGWTRSKSYKDGKHSEVETFSGATLPQPFVSSGYNTASTGKVQTDIDADRTLVTDQAGKQRISKTNALGQLMNVWEVKTSDADTESLTFGSLSLNALKTSYAYDPLNNLTTVTQGGQTRSFSYSSLSRLKSANNPESGTINYVYDNNGNLSTKTDARSISTVYAYDALNRVISRDYSDTATPDALYTYDNAANAKGKLTKVTSGTLSGGAISNPFSVTEYTSFDLMGRVTGHKQTTDGQSYTTGYAYNLSGALTEETYPSGRGVKNVLDTDGDLAIVQSKKNANSGYWSYAKAFTYTAAGAVSSMQLGNGRWESTQFNSRLQPTQIALGTIQNGTDKLKLNFAYNTTGNADNNGNVLSQTITVPTEVRNSTTYNGFTATQNYTYDSLNRIHDASETISSTQQWKQTFQYDRYGNRTFDEANTTTLPKNCGSSPSFTVCTADRKIYNPTPNTSDNRLSTSDGYQFDSAGNTTRDAQSRKFTYDGENKQTKVETVDSNGNPVSTIGEYYYDGDGKRVKKVSASEITIFIYDASGKMVAEYSTALSQTPQVSYLTSDHLGSPRINTDQNGAVTARHDYQPFGEEIQRVSYGADDVRKQFTGYEKDEETDLDFAQARMYANQFGRFTSADPIFIDMKRLPDPQRINLYGYARNNPLFYTDPLGMDIIAEVDKKLTKEEKIALYKKYEDYLNKYFNGSAKVTVGSNGKVSIANINKGGVAKLGGSAQNLVTAITDSTYTGTVDLGNGQQNNSIAFGAATDFGKNALDLSEVSTLDQAKVGISGAEVVAHETLESYTTAKYHALDKDFPLQNMVSSLHTGEFTTGGLPMLEYPASFTPQNCSKGNCNTATGTAKVLRSGDTVGSFKMTFEFQTPIPKADIEKNNFHNTFVVKKVEKK